MKNNEKSIKNYTVFFTIYYTLILVASLYDIYAIFHSGYKLSEAFYMKTFSLITYFFVFIDYIIILLSIIFLILIYKRKLPKFYLIYPIYKILFHLIFIIIIPTWILLYYPENIALNILDNLSWYHIFFYFFDVGFSIFAFFKLNKI